MKSLVLSFLLVLMAIPGMGYAATEDAIYEEGHAGYNDPFESYNRGVLKFNNVMDTFVFDPITETYQFVVPQQGRKVVNNILRNLRSPLDLANQILQGDVAGGGTVLFRFVVNTFAGFGGILDVAQWEGIEYEGEDLGQTLATWGVGDGPYVVVPFFGPASLRDALSYGAESYADPVARYYFNIEEDHIAYKYNAVGFLDQKNGLYKAQKDLKKNSFDYYSTLKSAVYQNRQAAIADFGKETSKDDASFAYIPDDDSDF